MIQRASNHSDNYHQRYSPIQDYAVIGDCRRTPISGIIAHIAYGGILGTFYQLLGRLS